VTHMATKINQVIAKRSRRKSKSLGVDVTPAEVRVCLSENGSIVSTSELNASAWTDGKCLQIEDQMFHVCVNVPTIRKLSLLQPMIVGFPVYVNIDLEFGDMSDCEFTWYRVGNSAVAVETSQDEDQEQNLTKTPKKSRQSNGSAIKLFCGRFYIPTAEDVGFQLKLVCTPVRGDVTGESITTTSSATVQSGPTTSFPFEKRHRFTDHVMSGDRSLLLILHFVFE